MNRIRYYHNLSKLCRLTVMNDTKLLVLSCVYPVESDFIMCTYSITIFKAKNLFKYVDWRRLLVRQKHFLN